MIRKYINALKFENFERDRDRINEENRSGTELLLLFTAAIIVINVVVELFAGHVSMRSAGNLLAQSIYCVVGMLLYYLVLRKRKSDFTLWIYFFEIPLMVITMIAGTVMEQDRMTFTFFLFLLLLPTLILDRPWHIAVFILATASAYATVDFAVKDAALFQRDILHLFNVSLMSVAASLYSLATRIQNIDYADYFAEQSYRDPLTGLYNRRGAARYVDTKKPGVLAYIDLDNFKEINDTCGHAEGDRILQCTAQILRSDFRADDVIIRLGGDEFAIYASGRWTEKLLRERLARLLGDIRKVRTSPDKTEGKEEITVSVSIGCVYAENGCESFDRMLAAADKEMYHIKQSGKNSYGVVKIS